MVKDKKQYLYNKNVQIFSLCLKYREGEKMNYIKKLKIGNVELENNLILAPMAGVTNRPFRMICKEYGAGMVCTEMASARAMYHNDLKTKRLLNTCLLYTSPSPRDCS